MAIKFLNTATAATQAVGDNSTKIATTAYADTAASAIPIGDYLPLSAGASKPLTGGLYIPHYIYHAGDNGTFIGFPANDRLIIGTNGGTRVDITNSGFCLGDSGSNISVSTILDEDDMASDSATALVTQQSIKAYVDAQTPGAGVFLPLAGGTMNTNAAITMSGSLTTSANVYAQRFYDQGNNSFYGDFAGTSQFNHVKVNSVLGTRNFVSGSYGWQLEQSSTTGTPVTFRFDNQKYRVFAGGGAGEIMTFLEGGNVGIGATAPAAKLHVVGKQMITTGANASPQTEDYLFIGGDGLASANASIYIGNRGDGTGYGWRMLYEGVGSGVNNKLKFRSENLGSPVDVITMTQDGNVGIGTASPASLLEISKQLSAASTIDYPYTISSRDDGNSINQAGGEGVGIKFRIAGNAATTPGDSLVGASIAAIRESASDTDSSTGLGFFVTQNDETLDEALRIDHDGNVGIGTNDPDQKLHIKGGDIQTQDTTGSNGVLRIRATITGTPSTGGYPNVGAGDAVIEGGGTTQRQPGVITLMNGDSSISSGQDLGVIQFVGKDDASNGYCTSQIISTTSGSTGSGSSGGGILRFLTSPGGTGAAVEERMRINNSGRVMIGTTTSTSNANLTVKDSLAIQSGSSTVLSITTGYGSSFINTGTSGGTVKFGAPTSYTTNVYVQGTIEAVSSVQMGNNTAAASAANAGSTRYRVSGNNSYMDMSMRTGSTTYAWVNIVQNNW